MKIHNKIERHNIATTHSVEFMMIYRKHTSKPCSFLTIGTTLPTDDSLCLRGNLLGSL